MDEIPDTEVTVNDIAARLVELAKEDKHFRTLRDTLAQDFPGHTISDDTLDEALLRIARGWVKGNPVHAKFWLKEADTGIIRFIFTDAFKRVGEAPFNDGGINSELAYELAFKADREHAGRNPAEWNR